MRGFTMSMFLACIAATFVKELAADPDGKLVDDLVDTLTDATYALSQPGTKVINVKGMSVQGMQNTLKMYGVPPSPLQKLALTQLAATRDPSMMAQVREEFQKVDFATQNKLKKISKEIYVRAGGGWISKYSGADAAEGEKNLMLEKLPGATAPLSADGAWDPLSLTADIPAGLLYFYREAELKNGRLAMLAFLSIVVTDKLGIHPFYKGVEYVSAIQNHAVIDPFPQNFWTGLLVAGGFAELFSYPDRSKAPGDLGFDPLGLKPKSDKEFLEVQNKELNNGRLAMIAMAGIFAQEALGAKVF
jgi:light-harvesting complex I chlorophyll a/b binding protein 1